jgi:hypothetical protein
LVVAEAKKKVKVSSSATTPRSFRTPAESESEPDSPPKKSPKKSPPPKRTSPRKQKKEEDEPYVPSPTDKEEEEPVSPQPTKKKPAAKSKKTAVVVPVAQPTLAEETPRRSRRLRSDDATYHPKKDPTAVEEEEEEAQQTPATVSRSYNLRNRQLSAETPMTPQNQVQQPLRQAMTERPRPHSARMTLSSRKITQSAKKRT